MSSRKIRHAESNQRSSDMKTSAVLKYGKDFQVDFDMCSLVAVDFGVRVDVNITCMLALMLRLSMMLFSVNDQLLTIAR